MPGQPPRADVYVDKPLTNMTLMMLSQRARYMNRRLPTINVTQQSGLYYIYPQDFFLRTDAAHRAPGAESRGSGFELTQGTYTAHVYAQHIMVDDQTRRNADSGLQLDRTAALHVAEAVDFRIEQVFDALLDSSSFTTTSTPSTSWSDASSDPIGDVYGQFNAIYEKTGVKPNTFIAGAETDRYLKQHPDILGRIVYTQRGIITDDLLAALFNVDTYMVHAVTKNSSAEQATASYDWLGGSGNNALLCYLEPNPGLMTPTALSVFQWYDTEVSRWRKEDNKADKIEVERAVDIKVVAQALAVEFVNAIS